MLYHVCTCICFIIKENVNKLNWETNVSQSQYKVHISGRVKLWKVAALSEAARVSLFSPNPNHDPTPPALVSTMAQFPNTGVFLGKIFIFFNWPLLVMTIVETCFSQVRLVTSFTTRSSTQNTSTTPSGSSTLSKISPTLPTCRNWILFRWNLVSRWRRTQCGTF